MDLWIVPAWSFKNKEVFQIRLVDRPRALFRFVPAWALKNGKVFRIGLDFMVSVLLSASVEIVGVSRMRDLV